MCDAKDRTSLPRGIVKIPWLSGRIWLERREKWPLPGRRPIPIQLRHPLGKRLKAPGRSLTGGADIGFAVVNREGGYTEELKSLEGLAWRSSAFQRKRTETEIIENEELTRFNRAAVDRELRMIELKKQINELCGRLGQQPRYPLDFGPGQESPAAPQEGRS